MSSRLQTGFPATFARDPYNQSPSHTPRVRAYVSIRILIAVRAYKSVCRTIIAREFAYTAGVRARTYIITRSHAMFHISPPSSVRVCRTLRARRGQLHVTAGTPSNRPRAHSNVVLQK